MSMASSILTDAVLRPPAVVADRPAVSLRNVGMIYAGNVIALRNITLEIEPGRHVVILGGSGSGKTTLLGCLSGRLQPTSGEARCQGRIATIHQDLRLVKQQSALANVLHGAMGRHSLWRTLFCFPAHERQRAVDLLNRVGLDHRIHASVGRLSGGEQQRVAIARALMQDPTILLADEPVASLDNANARAIMRLLSELQRERGLTLVSVLHDCALAETFADRILGFEAGQIVHDDTACDHLTIGAMPASPLVRFGEEGDAGIAPTHQNNLDGVLGLRGFRRFDACRACESLATAAANPDDPPVKSPRSWKFALLAVLAAAIYIASVAHLEIGQRETENFFSNILSFAGRLVPHSWAQASNIGWSALGWSLLATLEMSLLGTTAAVFISWPLAAIAAKNVGPRRLRPIMRFALNALRSVPSIIWALLFVSAVGLGAFAGVLALIVYSIGYLTKFFYEAFEAVESGPPEALREIGASGLQRFWHAVWPAARAAVLSSSLFMLEYNVRAASVLGIVGAGGIGHDLKLHVDWSNFHVVGAILLMLVAVVLVLDAISSRIRILLLRA